MVEEDAGDALRRSLGLKPRTPSTSASIASSEAGASAGASSTSTSATSTPATSTSGASTPGAKPLPRRASDLGLGVRRRSQSTAQSTASGAVAERVDEPITDPTKKPVGNLNPDAARLLRQWYMARPELDLPAFVTSLPGTHGWYMGDAREGREINVGFTPAFVLYTLPLYPDGPPEWVKGEFLMPSLPEQPPYTERGFLVPPHLNQVNVMCMYIVWRSPVALSAAPVAAGGTAAGAPSDESPRDRRRREEMAKRKADLEARKARNEASKRR